MNGWRTAALIAALAVACVSAAHRDSRAEGSGDSRKGQICGNAANPRCGANEVCEIPAGNCEKADVTGTCVARPENCTQDYNPVCGCDGTTYSNDCMRLMAGARKKQGGECDAAKPPDPVK